MGRARLGRTGCIRSPAEELAGCWPVPGAGEGLREGSGSLTKPRFRVNLGSRATESRRDSQGQGQFSSDHPDLQGSEKRRGHCRKRTGAVFPQVQSSSTKLGPKQLSYFQVALGNHGETCQNARHSAPSSVPLVPGRDLPAALAQPPPPARPAPRSSRPPSQGRSGDQARQAFTRGCTVPGDVGRGPEGSAERTPASPADSQSPRLLGEALPARLRPPAWPWHLALAAGVKEDEPRHLDLRGLRGSARGARCSGAGAGLALGRHPSRHRPRPRPSLPPSPRALTLVLPSAGSQAPVTPSDLTNHLPGWAAC